jgi:tRNA threonylcarbamoyl adenosine modification protein YeaZ
MKILALEFSSPRRSAAVVETRSGDQPALLGCARESDSRPRRGLALVDLAVREAAVRPDQIGCLAIGLGPGSYTGIRSAIAIAQGWQLARGARLLGVSSVECLAQQARAEGICGRLQIVIDAQRNEFYLASYDLSETECRLVQPLRLGSFEVVLASQKADEQIVGPEVTQWFPAGQMVFPDAATLGQLAANRTDFVAGEKLEPIYLRAASFVKAPPPRILPELR